MGLNVLPTYFVNDLPHRAIADTIFFGEHVNGFLSWNVFGSDLFDLDFGQSRIDMLFAALTTASLVAIFHIVLKSAHVKMARSDAFAIVAGVKNLFAFRNVTSGYYPRGSRSLFTATINSESSVPVFELSGPLPARFCFYNFCPEFFHKCSIALHLEGV